MNIKSKPIDRITLLGLETLLLFLIFAGIILQLMLGKGHVFFLLLRLIYAPGMVFLAGLSVSYFRHNPFFLIKKGIVYSILYFFFGMCNLFLLHHKLPFKSLITLLTMQKIPASSEMFFTAAILFFCAALATRYYQQICSHRKMIAGFSIASLLFAYFPSTVFGYPILGVFFDCETYACIPLLPYLCFFTAGIFFCKTSIQFNKNYVFASAGITIASALLYFTPAKEMVLCTVAVLPICLMYLFCNYCSLYRKVMKGLMACYEKLLSKLQEWYGDFACSKRKVLPLYFFVYTILFAVMFCCVFYAFVEYDNSIAWMRDAISQYIPRVYYFSDYIRDCFSHILDGNFDFPSYSFRIGMGDSVRLSFEPLYWLYALFDSSHVEFAYNFIAILRFYLAGVSASVFFLYYKKSYFGSLLGSMVYTFCGFAIFAGVLHTHFIAPMIFLPLLILSTEEIFQKKRWYLCTILVALALPSNYYFIYMSTLAMGIYYVGRFLFTRNPAQKNWKYFFTTTATFAGAYLLGVIIGNISLFTSFSSYVGSGRTGSHKLITSSLFYYGEKWLTDFYVYFISTPKTPGAWLKLGFIPLSYLAIVVLLMKKGRGFIKFLLFTCITFCIFPIAAFVFGGFSTITNRWCYILALLVSFITAWAIPELRNLSRRELKILLFSLFPYAAIVLFDRSFRTESNLSALAVLLCNYIIIVCMNKNLKILNRHFASLLLMFLCCISLTLNGFYQFHGGNNTSKDDFAKQGAVLKEMQDTPMKVLSDYSDDTFYRVSTTSIPMRNQTSSLVLNYNSIATFSSTISGPIVDYNIEMGNSAWSIVRLGGFDNRTFMNALACVKYYAINPQNASKLPYGFTKIDSVDEDGETIDIYKNDYALPIGYTYDHVIDEQQLNSYNAVEKQEILLQSAVVENKEGIEDLDSKNSSSDSVSVQKIEISSYEADGIEFHEGTATVTKPGATLTLNFDGLENSETYLVFSGECNPYKSDPQHASNGSIASGEYKRDFSIRSTSHTYSTGQDCFVFNLGYRKDSMNSCTITFDNICSFTYDSLDVYCQPMEKYASYIEQLTKNTLENVVWDSNTLTGTISVDSDKLLALSIPYQKGWTAYVDGKETEIQKVNLMYSGLSLTPGTHEIKLEYKTPGIGTSLCLSGIGIVIFVVALAIRRKRNRSR